MFVRELLLTTSKAQVPEPLPCAACKSVVTDRDKSGESAMVSSSFEIVFGQSLVFFYYKIVKICRSNARIVIHRENP